MNDEVETNTPVIDTETNDDDFFGEVNDEVIEETKESTSEDETDDKDSQPSEPETEEESDEEKEEVDFKPLLEELSKRVKYNKESVNVDNIDDLVSNFQKGLNYDKLQDKLQGLQTSKAETYINKKANDLGMTVDQYIEEVERYEQEQERAREQERLEEMVNNGVPEDVAKEVIATSQLRKQLQEKENELKEKEEATKRESQKNKEYEDFIKSFPDVKADEIPKEVFKNAESSSLKQAYTEWKLAELEKKLAIKQQNEENLSASVGAVTTNGTTKENKSQDLFMQGFDSI